MVGFLFLVLEVMEKVVLLLQQLLYPQAQSLYLLLLLRGELVEVGVAVRALHLPVDRPRVVNYRLGVQNGLVLLDDVLLNLHGLLRVGEGHLRLPLQGLNEFVVHHDQGRGLSRRVQLFEEEGDSFPELDHPLLGEDYLESGVVLGLLQVGQGVVLQEFGLFGEVGAPALEISTEVGLGLAIGELLPPEGGVDVVDEEVQLYVELHPHGLGVLGPHGEGDEVAELDHELVPVSLVEQLYCGMGTASSSFFMASWFFTGFLVGRQQSF